MSYTQKETKILTDYHRQHGKSSPAPLEILEQRIELYESWQRPSCIPIKFAKMQASFFWEGYCDGAGLDWDIREAGRRRVQQMED